MHRSPSPFDSYPSKRLHKLVEPLNTVALIAALLSLTACGDPPTQGGGGGPAAVAPAPTPESVIESTGDATVASPDNEVVATAEPTPEPARPEGVPEGAEIVRGITPGKKGGTLARGIVSEPKSFNQLFGSSINDQEAQALLSASLSGYDSYAQETVPGLATHWEYDATNRNWTFHLREGLKWSDGAPLTSDDFLFFTQLVYDEKIPNTYKTFFRGKDAETGEDIPYEFSAPDPLTFVAHIPVVDSFAFQTLGMLRPMPRHALGAVWEAGNFTEDVWNYGTNPKEVISCGAFVLDTVRSGQSLIFKPNPHYFRYDENGTQLPYADQLVLLVVQDQEAMELRFRNGELDFLEGIKPENLANLMDMSAQLGYTVHRMGPSLNVNHFYFNLNEGGSYEGEDGTRQTWQPTARGEQPPAELKDFRYFIDPARRAWFANEEFRIACSEAIDRDRIINNVLFGLGAPLYGPVSQANEQWYNPNIPKFPHDPDSANARLDALGYLDANGDGVREDAEGRPIRFTILTNRGNEVREQVGLILREDLRRVGLGAEMEVLDFNELITRIDKTYDYDAVLLGLGTGIPPHPSMAGAVWQSSGETHMWYPKQIVPATDWEAEIDGLYAAMKREFDEEKQVEIFHRMQEIYCRHQPAIHLFTGESLAAAFDNIGNVKPTTIRSSVTHNIDELYIINPRR